MTDPTARTGPGPTGAQAAAEWASGPVPAPFDRLLAAARQIASRAYVPYSRYQVGAAALVDDERLVRGCNVENASYGVSLCAECGLISELVAGGGGRLRAFVCVNGEGTVIMPCGRCRQLLNEHAADDFSILTPQGPRTLEQILPQAFGAHDIEEVATHG